MEDCTINEDLETIKDIVIEILEKYPETRSSDHELELRYLLETGLATRINNGIYISFNNYRKKCLATVRRIRRKLQQEGYYLPNDTVNQGRLLKEREMRTMFDPRNQWTPYPSHIGYTQKTLFIEKES